MNIEQCIPILKSSLWAMQTSKHGVMADDFPAGTTPPAELKPYAPKLAYAFDNDNNLIYLQTGMQLSETQLSALKAQSLKNMEARLDEITFEKVQQPTPFGTLDYLIAHSQYHATELLLSKARMNQLQCENNADFLYVSTPQRGLLMVATSKISAECLEVFCNVSVDQFLDNESNAITPIVWQVSEGNIIGLELAYDYLKSEIKANNTRS